MMLWQPEQWIWLHKGHKALLWQQSSHLYKHFLPCLCLCIMGCSHIFSLSPVWDVQHLAEALSVPNHLVHQLPAFIVVGGADHKLFNLGKRIKINNWAGSTVLTKWKGVFMAQSAEIKRGFTAPTTTDLFKLMHPEDAPSVPTMTAHLEAN